MAVKRPSTSSPKVAPKSHDDDVFAFILDQSKKTLSFPLSAEISEKFGFSGTYVFNVLERLIAQGRIAKVGRYHFRISPEYLPPETGE